MQDPYRVLGISPTASEDEIKKAYRALAKKYQKFEGAGIIAGLRFNIGSGIFTSIIFFVLSGFRLEFPLFSGLFSTSAL